MSHERQTDDERHIDVVAKIQEFELGNSTLQFDLISLRNQVADLSMPTQSQTQTETHICQFCATYVDDQNMSECNKEGEALKTICAKRQLYQEDRIESIEQCIHKMEQHLENLGPHLEKHLDILLHEMVPGLVQKSFATEWRNMQRM